MTAASKTLNIPDYVREAQAGSESAWAVLHERHYRDVLRIATRLVGENDADDVAQETFGKLVRGSLASFRGECQFSTWLYRVAFTQGLAWLRARRSRLSPESLDALVEEFGESLDGLAQDDGFLAQAADRARLIRALMALDSKYRVAVTVRDVWGYSEREGAEILGLPVPTLKARTQRGHKMLRAHLGKR